VVCAACLDGLREPGDWRALVADQAGPDACHCLFRFEGRGRDLVVALKYRNGRELGRLLGAAMATLVAPAGFDAVTWAPTSRIRLGQRGYDQSRLLAQGVAGALDLPCRDLLARQAGRPQTGRSMTERLVGPRFRARRSSPARVVVVDDVVTTGATLAAASAALRSAGASEVVAVAAACTPRRFAAHPGLKTGVR
jgi:predicted amidophosphoribosyltransferase